MSGMSVKEKKGEAAGGKVRVRIIISAAVAAVVIAGIVGVAIYQDRVAPFHTPVLVVDGRSITMRYLLKRVCLSGREPLSMFQTLASEEIIKQVAPKPPYSIQISEKDVDDWLMQMARGESEGISGSEFKEWYRQRLNESQLTDLEFRDLARTNLLTRRLEEYLAQRVPTVAEQVHLHAIPFNSPDDARRAKERLDAGADFGTLARELSSDEELKKSGGDLGWFPRGALDPALAQAAFGELQIGKASDPIYLDGNSFAIVMVSERAAARAIEESALQWLKALVLEEWLDRELPSHKVELRGFRKDSYDSETDAWVRWQLQKMQKPAARSEPQ